MRKNARIGLEPLELDKNHGAYVPSHLKARTHVKADRAKRLKARRSLAYPSRNGYGDPLSNALLLDLLVRLKKDQVIRAGTLAPVLQDEFPQLGWEAYTVGRMLSNLATSAQEANPDDPAIRTAQDWYGRYFLIDPSAAAHEWLLETLELLGAHAEATIQNLKEGERPGPRMGDPVGMAQAAVMA